MRTEIVFRAEKSKSHSERVGLSELHRSAVDQALKSKNGHLDLFLRFLLGLSLDSSQILFRGLLTQTGSRSPVPDLQHRQKADHRALRKQSSTLRRGSERNLQQRGSSICSTVSVN
uniref:NACHT LRR and PYD domain-containing protein n=1 Tax=Anguilla anguilla TaxID=7936 RepID=A0A0E9RLU8_ANGAN